MRNPRNLSLRTPIHYLHHHFHCHCHCHCHCHQHLYNIFFDCGIAALPKMPQFRNSVTNNLQPRPLTKYAQWQKSKYIAKNLKLLPKIKTLQQKKRYCQNLFFLQSAILTHRFCGWKPVGTSLLLSICFLNSECLILKYFCGRKGTNYQIIRKLNTKHCMWIIPALCQIYFVLYCALRKITASIATSSLLSLGDCQRGTNKKKIYCELGEKKQLH